MWLEYVSIFVLTLTSVFGIISIINFFAEKSYKYTPKKYVKLFMLVNKKTDEIELEIREILNENDYPLVVVDDGLSDEDKEKLEIIKKYNPNLDIIDISELTDYLRDNLG